MTISVWFDGDETLWDRKGFMLTGLLEPAMGEEQGDERTPELYSDVLPTFVALTETGTVNLIEYGPLPVGNDDLLPPFNCRTHGPQAPSDLAPELHHAESSVHWAHVLDGIAARTEEGAQVVLVSTNVGALDIAGERGWVTVWLNRDRVANLSETMPTAEIHSLLDLPQALESLDEARAELVGEFGPSSPA